MPPASGRTARARPHAAALRALLANPKLPADDRRRLVATVLPAYRAWRQAAALAGAAATRTAGAVPAALAALDRYSRVVELELIYDSPNTFLPRQAGQLKLVSTLLEEFLPTLVTPAVLGCPPPAADIGPARALAGFAVDIDGRVQLTTKDQDFAVTRTVELTVDGPAGVQQLTAAVPLVVVECKVNFDATMFNEARASATALKAVAPDAAYFVVCDWLDMTVRPTAGTGIDNVLILRGRRPGSGDRLAGLAAADRPARRAEYAAHLDAHPRRSAPLAPLVAALAARLGPMPADDDDAVAAGMF